MDTTAYVIVVPRRGYIRRSNQNRPRIGQIGEIIFYYIPFWGFFRARVYRQIEAKGEKKNMSGNTKETKATTTAATSKVNSELEQLKKDNADLRSRLDSLMELLLKTQAASAAPAVNIVTPSTDVTLVYCSDSMGYLKTSHVELKFNRWGEKFTLSRSQFDEVVGMYRSWFDAGILAVSGDTEEGIRVAADKGIKTSNELNMDASTLDRLGSMGIDEVEKLWNEQKFDEHKQSIATYIKRKFIEGDKAYERRDLIDLMNRLTNGGFRREQDELDGRYTYEAKQFNKGDRSR